MRRILLITMGMTPQIVTETLHALWQERDWLPDTVILATTERGKEECERHLIYEGGPLDRLIELIGIDRPVLEFLVAHGGDVGSSDEALDFAEALMPRLRELTSDADTELHLSVAGGRKTMGAIAHSLMQFFGRGADRDTVSHLFVDQSACPAGSQSLESNRDFWWPGCTDDPAIQSARLVLHELPYPQLRILLNDDQLFGTGETSYRALVERTNLTLGQNIVIDIENGLIFTSGRRAILDPQTFAVIATILISRKMGTEIGQLGTGDTKQYALDGNVKGFVRLWAIIRSLRGIEALHLAAEADTAAARTEVEFKATEHASNFDWQMIDVPLSNARRALDRIFLPPMRKKIISPERGVKRTNFAANEIDVKFPRHFDLKYLIDYIGD